VVKGIRDDGPAAAPVERPESTAFQPKPERGEIRASDPVDDSAASARTHGSIRGNGWSRAALAALGAFAVAFAVTLGLWVGYPDVGSAPSSSGEPPVPDELDSLVVSVAALRARVEGLDQESETRVREIRQLVRDTERSTTQKMASLEKRVEQTQRAQADLLALAQRLGSLADQIKSAAVVHPGSQEDGQGPSGKPASVVTGQNAAAVQVAEGGAPAVSAEAAQAPAGKGAGRLLDARKTREAPRQEAAANAARSALPPRAKSANGPQPVPVEKEASPVTQEAAAVQDAPATSSGAAKSPDLPTPHAPPSRGPTARVASAEMPTSKREADQVPTTLSHTSPVEDGSKEVTAPVPARKNRSTGAIALAPELANPKAAGGPGQLKEPIKPSGGDTGEQWVINLVALSSGEKAEAAQRMYDEKGVLADVVELRRSGSRVTLYGVQVPGFGSREEAMAFVPTLRARLGIKDVWIHRR
jgi:hypothetical protein